jgi:thiamine phosphate synthase YjbQ (UPF0047 family)
MLSGLENTHVKDALRELGLTIGATHNNISNLDNRITVLEAKPDSSNDISNINNEITNLNDNITSVLYI